MSSRGRTSGENNADMAFFLVGLPKRLIRGGRSKDRLHWVVNNIRKFISTGGVDLEPVAGLGFEAGVRVLKNRTEFRDEAQTFSQYRVIGADRLGYLRFGQKFLRIHECHFPLQRIAIDG